MHARTDYICYRLRRAALYHVPTPMWWHRLIDALLLPATVRHERRMLSLR